MRELSKRDKLAPLRVGMSKNKHLFKGPKKIYKGDVPMTLNDNKALLGV